MYLSIIIPAYNEEKRIARTLSGINDYLALRDYDYEVTVIDDGSRDETVAVASESRLAKEGKLRVISNGINRGKGFSVRQGILDSKGDYVLFSDADLSTPISEIEKLFSHIASGYDIVIGSRSVSDSDVRIHQPWPRERMGKIFNLFVTLLVVRGFNDTQCGFKLFKGDVARQLAGWLKIEGFCFDVEMMYLAKNKGYKIKEAGVIWENSTQSKVRVIGSSWNMFWDLFRMKRLHK